MCALDHTSTEEVQLEHQDGLSFFSLLFANVRLEEQILEQELCYQFLHCSSLKEVSVWKKRP